MPNDSLNRFSQVLKNLGFANMLELLESAKNSNVNLGKVEIAKLNNIQLNSLFSLQLALNQRSYVGYFDKDFNLIVTSRYQFNRSVMAQEQQDIVFEEMTIEPHIDYIFGLK